MTDKPNIILIIVDSLRADHVGWYGYNRDTTPTLDRLADEGVAFTRAYTQAPFTTSSTATIFSGLYPSEHDMFLYTDKNIANLETIPKFLKKKGYNTYAYVLNPHISPRVGYDGFDKFRIYWGGGKEFTKFAEFGGHEVKIFDYFCQRKGRDDISRFEVLEILTKYKDTLKDILKIPQAKNVDEDEYITARDDVIDAWNKLIGLFDMEDVNSKL